LKNGCGIRISSKSKYTFLHDNYASQGNY